MVADLGEQLVSALGRHPGESRDPRASAATGTLDWLRVRVSEGDRRTDARIGLELQMPFAWR